MEAVPPASLNCHSNLFTDHPGAEIDQANRNGFCVHFGIQENTYKPKETSQTKRLSLFIQIQKLEGHGPIITLLMRSVPMPAYSNLAIKLK